jgi:hypothetical protein
VVRDAFVLTHGASRSFCVNDFAERCNEKQTKNEETKIVRWRVKVVRQPGLLLWAIMTHAPNPHRLCLGGRAAAATAK